MILLGTFFAARLCWGVYQSVSVFYDVWHGLHLDSYAMQAGQSLSDRTTSIFVPRDGQLCMGEASCVLAQTEVMKFTGQETGALPIWLASVYLISNVTLNSLNFYWFGKMIETVMKRFRPEEGEKGKEKQGGRPERRKSVIEHAADELDRETLSGPSGPLTPLIEQSETSAMASGVADGNADLSKRR